MAGSVVLVRVVRNLQIGLTLRREGMTVVVG